MIHIEVLLKPQPFFDKKLYTSKLEAQTSREPLGNFCRVFYTFEVHTVVL